MQKTLTFVSANAGTSAKSGKSYNLVSLSNGLRTGTLNNPQSLDVSHLKEGDKVNVTFDLDLSYKNEFILIPVKIEKVK